jgi:thioredoxin 1
MTNHFDDNNFQQEVIDASKNKPVLVDFYAEWCGPCKLQGPIIDEIAEKLGEKAIVGKVNTEEAANIAEKFNVMSIPTIMIFKDGQAVETLVGLNSRESLMSVLDKYL